MADKAKDYLAVISQGIAGSWARGPDKAKAIKAVAGIFRRDFKPYVKLKKGSTVTVNVVDVTGFKTVWWNESGFYVGETKLDRPIEKHQHTY